MRFTRQRSKVNLDVVEEIVPSSKEEKKDKNNSIIDIEQVLKKREYKYRKYLEAVKKFLDDKTEYEYMAEIPFLEMRDKFTEYVYDPVNEIQIDIDVSYRLCVKDLAMIHKEVKFKRIIACKFCDRKHNSKCCEQYQKNRKKSTYNVVNLKFI